MTIMIPLGAFALLLFLLATAGQHDQNQVLARWEMRLNPEGLKVYSDVADQILWDRQMIDTSYEDAAAAHRNHNRADTLHFLDLAARIVADCSSSFATLVVNIGSLARFAEAIAPMPPLSPGAFRIREIFILAGLHQAGHHILVTTRDRLRFRVVVLRAGLSAVTHVLIRATHLTRSRPELSERWRHMEAARADLGTLTDQSLQTLRTVLASLAAVRRPAPESKTA